MSRLLKILLIIACVVLHICAVKSIDKAAKLPKQSVPGNALVKNSYPAEALP